MRGQRRKEAMERVAERSALTEKQRAFCQFCAEGKSPKEAARLAGYKNFGSEAGKLMRMSKIQRGIERRKKAGSGGAAEKAVAESDEILSFLTEMMREDDDPRMRMKAAELLGKRVSLFEKEQGKAESRVIIVDDIS